MAEIAAAATEEDFVIARQLFGEYAESLPFDLDFQDFDQELKSFPGKYAQPAGCLLLGRVDGQVAGVVGLRPLEDGACEMKRLYLRPAYRGIGLGKDLAVAVIAEARKRGYRAMRLDTLGDTMQAAISVYKKLGFREIDLYTHNPLPDAIYMELDLS